MRGMPATFPAHPAAVLPLKLWRPAWFDGVALAAGSMAPDLAYALDGSPLERPFRGLPPMWELAHSLPWFLFWALPVTFALCPLIRLALRALMFRLSSGLVGALFGLATRVLAPPRGYASLGRGPRWYVTASSAGVGALSHVLWDRIAVGPFDLVSSLAGGFFGLWLLFAAARLLNPVADSPAAAAEGPALTPARDSGSGLDAGGRGGAVVYWGTVAAVFVVGAAFLPFLPGYFLPHTTSARVILLAIAAFLLAAAASRSRRFRREPLQQ